MLGICEIVRPAALFPCASPSSAALFPFQNGRLPAFLWFAYRAFMVAFRLVLGKTTRDFLKNHRRFFLKPQVTFLKTTGGFIQDTPESYQRKPGTRPKKPPPTPNFSPSLLGFCPFPRQFSRASKAVSKAWPYAYLAQEIPLLSSGDTSQA